MSAEEQIDEGTNSGAVNVSRGMDEMKELFTIRSLSVTSLAFSFSVSCE